MGQRPYIGGCRIALAIRCTFGSKVLVSQSETGKYIQEDN